MHAKDSEFCVGADSIGAPQDHEYGERGAGVKDPAGNFWYIATHKSENYIPKGLRNANVYMHPLRAEPVIAFLKRAFDAEAIRDLENRDRAGLQTAADRR